MEIADIKDVPALSMVKIHQECLEKLQGFRTVEVLLTRFRWTYHDKPQGRFLTIKGDTL